MHKPNKKELMRRITYRALGPWQWSCPHCEQATVQRGCFLCEDKHLVREQVSAAYRMNGVDGVYALVDLLWTASGLESL